MIDNDVLEALAPETVTVTINGAAIEITPLKFLPLLKVLKLLIKMSSTSDFTNMNEYAAIKMLAEYPDETLNILEIATAKPKGFFDAMDMVEGAELIIAVLKVNQDFFMERVLPKLESLNQSSSPDPTETSPTTE